MFKSFIVIISLLVSAHVYADNTPLQVNASRIYLLNNKNLPVWQFNIASKDNDITIQSIVLNRGNCLISMQGRGKNVNKRLGYGGNLTFTTPSNDGFSKCKPLELTIGTNKGEFTYNW
ncbi:hypothetical protein [Budvicia aquatica]|uniref:Uncharacterized protein n=1 Tax=Budvicia aquatica TaxID=82979 RepID=A0A2C6DV88_9GAMM|nr:hypothetical protein [Budvicia aquatica]PHI32242.1 hypothetical protein CRN84_24440 [Budvicia aquatica]VFS45157.1 Uncharacterised protein [Budvicia aquatica]